MEPSSLNKESLEIRNNSLKKSLGLLLQLQFMLEECLVVVVFSEVVSLEEVM